MPRPHAPAPSLSWLQALRARWALVLSLGFGVAVAMALPDSLKLADITRAVIGWNAGILLYLAIDLQVIFGTSHQRMRQRAIEHDEGRAVVLVLIVVAAVVCLGTIVVELGQARDEQGGVRPWRAGLAALTILTCWTFIQVMFALHYAHAYYAAQHRGAPGGAAFPGETAPDYSDFLYMACVIGTSGQPADIAFTSRTMRRIGLVHSVLSFFFNATLLALSINIASGLI
jgi:uncharacterized membrane protein